MEMETDGAGTNGVSTALSWHWVCLDQMEQAVHTRQRRTRRHAGLPSLLSSLAAQS